MVIGCAYAAAFMGPFSYKIFAGSGLSTQQRKLIRLDARSWLTIAPGVAGLFIVMVGCLLATHVYFAVFNYSSIEMGVLHSFNPFCVNADAESQEGKRCGSRLFGGNFQQIFGDRKILWLIPTSPSATQQTCDGISWPLKSARLEDRVQMQEMPLQTTT